MEEKAHPEVWDGPFFEQVKNSAIEIAPDMPGELSGGIILVHFAHEEGDFKELYMQLKQFEKLCKKGVDFCRKRW